MKQSDKKILAIIPARSGSKGVPGKNTRPLAGKPLISWTIDAARKCRDIDYICATTDDEEIAKVARNAGASTPFIRPAEYATDTATAVDVILHTLDNLPKFDFFIYLQPTSPFRSARHIDEAIALFLLNNSNALVSVTPASKSPYWMYTMDKKSMAISPLLGEWETRPNRQELATVYALNGAIYIANVDWFRRTRSFLTPETVAFEMDSLSSVDIDDEIDFVFASALAERR